VHAATRRTRRAGTTDPRLVLVMKAGSDAGLLQAVLAACARDPHALPVRILFRTDRVKALHDGHADAALLFHPADDLHGLDTEPLITEPRMAVLPAAHPLADRTALTMADLSGEPLHDPAVPEPASLTELMQLIALGQRVAVVPASVARSARPDLVAVPVTDAPPVTLLLGWPAHSTSPAVAALARAVRTTCPGG
jgi:DNA-binding transcriptional LysR family regulator